MSASTLDRASSEAARWQSVSGTASDRYLKALLYGLVGYAVIGKGFAYLGVPPLYVGELLLLAGVAILSRTRCTLSTLAAPANIVLLILGAWTIIRTVPFLGIYGIDAIRDSVIVLYGTFGLIVCGLLVERPERIALAFHFYHRFARFYGGGAWIIYALTAASVDYKLLPAWPNSGWPLFAARPGEIAVHLSGSAVFAILFLRRPSLIWLISTLLGIGIVSAQSRGGMLSILIPVLIAVSITGRWQARSILRIAMAAVIIGTAAISLQSLLPNSKDRRSISVEQLMLNATSVVSGSEDEALAGTKAWRLLWWNKIIDYTVHGPYFWTGKGFGIGLADADGFDGSTTPDAPVLRSPHNASFTFLARAGVPGFTLWVLLIITWLGMMLRNMVIARFRNETGWSNMFLFIMCYFIAALVDASFDVALEGPMLGIWFWSLFGFGSGLTIIYGTYRAMPSGPRPLRRTSLKPRQ